MITCKNKNLIKCMKIKFYQENNDLWNTTVAFIIKPIIQISVEVNRDQASAQEE